ncbi:hypothetical protein THASP1DRAFT_23028 [Thamnocephalis sphaerospora]|uniref:Uncharacterized protein n=1 Tax=Thamnocephalis sphaerospora TaxID=78915 RepID=A0A4P9XSI9_9FUNG|nr:hypothetical protein THASP1DRAFT_23028 [Thamnocephalis sphaerospora]|eukprot:RKP09103.1 hypothetical protein THASP1DRAFT_23028 [Thamnocephalis sphaerospora]
MDRDVSSYYELACEQFKLALEAEPDTLDILQRLGDVYFSRSRLPLDSSKAIEAQLVADAKTCYLNGLKTEPEDMALMIRLAQVYHVQSQTDELKRLVADWHALGGDADLLHDDDDVFEMEFIDKVTELLKTSA